MVSYNMPSRRRYTLIVACLVVFSLYQIFMLKNPNPLHDRRLSPSPDQPLSEAAKSPSLTSDFSSQGSSESLFCADRFGARYLENLGNAAVEYCTRDSPSPLTCFHVSVSADHRVDTFCIGQNTVYDPKTQKFDLQCELGELDVPDALDSIPLYGNFRKYWYGSGPHGIFDDWVTLQKITKYGAPDIPPKYKVLVKREGSHNLWHSMMEIFSITMSMDVLSISQQLHDAHPKLAPANSYNTQVVLLDEYEDGPYSDLWSILSNEPPLRIKDLPAEVTSENIIVPLAGASNPFWEGDWETSLCTDSVLLRTFTDRVLRLYGLEDWKPQRTEHISLTFINRTQSRRLIDQEEYLKIIQSRFPNVEVLSIDFAAIPFRKQLEIIRRTDILLGVHGAGLTHSMFLPPRSTIIEILPPSLNHKGFHNVASVLGHSYYSGHGDRTRAQTKNTDWHAEDVFIEKEMFMNLMNAAMETM
ncbi:DUF563 domain-containing protein [Aspergillus ambiguus]|uniref:DUF563 domain protein n=1 Tax=Aspergillus ambiguus TaxID=176160 RepID=UPI003CCD26A1